MGAIHLAKVKETALSFCVTMLNFIWQTTNRKMASVLRISRRRQLTYLQISYTSGKGPLGSLYTTLSFPVHGFRDPWLVWRFKMETFFRAFLIYPSETFCFHLPDSLPLGQMSMKKLVCIYIILHVSQSYKY